MLLDTIKYSGSGAKIIFFFFTTLVVFIATMLIALGLGIVIMGGQDFITNIQSTNFELPEVISAQKFMQAFYTLGIFLFPALGFAYLNRSTPKQFLSLSQTPERRSVAYASILMVCAIPLVNYTYALNQQFPFPESIASFIKQMEENATIITKAFLSDTSIVSYLINMVLIAVLPAIGEEFFFRGVLQKHFGDWIKNKHIAIIITAIVFSALHMQFYGFLPRFILGIILGYLFVWSGNLWLPILAHFVTNGFTVTVTYYSKFATPDKLEKINTMETSSFQFAFLSSMIVSVLLYGIYQHEKNRKEKIITLQ